MMASSSKLLVLVIAVVSSLALLAGQLSLDECKRLAAQGDSEALYQMGVRYETGNGVRKENLRALANFRKAANKGHLEACRKLADLYEAGMIVGKDTVLAAKYRAMSVGQSGDEAEARAKAQSEEGKIDEIEVALDYIIGRNGKKRDAKSGIRLLYAAAKDKPVARRVFVQRWAKGDLDAGLDTIGTEEWELIVPWFKEQFDSGRCLMGGLILGNEAQLHGDYQTAIAYYKSAGRAGLAKAWFYLRKLYDAGVNVKDGGGPQSLHSEAKAIEAYENCLKIDPGCDTVTYYLGMIHMFSEGSNRNLSKSLSLFGRLLKRHPDDMWYLYAYGRAGYCLEWETFSRKWPNAKKLVEKGKQGYLSGQDRWDYNRCVSDFDKMVKRTEPYVECIRRSARKGCRPAKEFIEELKLDE